jgi:hypothetical protein
MVTDTMADIQTFIRGGAISGISGKNAVKNTGETGKIRELIK